jgi:hypothetical protein
MKKLIIYLAALFLLSIPSAVYGCSCAYSTPAMAFNDSKVVFIGKMTGGTEKNTLQERDGSSYEIESGEVTFDVEESFKGKPGKTVTIQIASMKGTSCGTYGLRRGEMYAVYAYAYKGDMLSSGVCTRTGTVSQAKEDVDFLRSLPPGGSGGTITGRVWLNTKAINGGGAKPLRGVSVRITGPRQKAVTVLTDKEGHFEASGLPAGIYMVTPKFPKNYFSDTDSAEVILSDLGTASAGFEAEYQSRIFGRISDMGGVPYIEGSPYLENSNAVIFGETFGKGRGFLIEGIPPGEYKMYIEINGPHDNDRKYYYPGTYDPSKAQTIKIVLGETKSGLRFILPKEFRVKTITGQVFWADGTPAADVEVLLLCPESAKANGDILETLPPGTKTDKKGWFSISAIGGTVYWLEARARKDGDEFLHSPLNKITVRSNIRNKKLVLSESGFSNGCGTSSNLGSGIADFGLKR